MKDYRLIDYVTQAYIVVVALLVLLFGREVPNWPLLLAGHVAAMGAVHGLIRLWAANRENKIIDLLRHFYPILLYTPFYRETGVLNHIFVDGYLDLAFIKLDHLIFGFQPSVSLMGKMPHIWVSEIFYASYFSYYIMISGVGLVLYLQKKERFFHYVTVISFVFYVCYLVYIALPVVGSRIFWAKVEGFPQDELTWYPLTFPETVQGGPFFYVMSLIYKHLEAHGAAFPSSHVAVALCTLYFTWRYIPRLRVVHGAAVVLLSIATVYCRYHYAIDVFAGVLTGLVLLMIGEWLYLTFDTGRPEPEPVVEASEGPVS